MKLDAFPRHIILNSSPLLQRPPPQTGLMTLKKLERLIRAGHGMGHLRAYKPWLVVTKRVTSSFSVNGHSSSPEWGRQHHYRSGDEEDTIQILKWLGATDVRDQYPAWPWEHDHPIVGLPGAPKVLRVPGLLSIAKSAGIRHGVYVGTKIPYVATLDLLSTWKLGGTYRVAAHECKPEKIRRDPSPVLRAKERLQLLKRYCEAAGIARFAGSTEDISEILLANLRDLDPKLSEKERTSIQDSAAYDLVVTHLARHAYEQSPTNVLAMLSDHHGICHDTLSVAFRLAIWNQDLDHDISTPLEFSLPLRRGGVALRSAMRKTWVGF